MSIKKITRHSIPDEALAFALTELRKISGGEIIFVAQDGFLMQVEINQRRRLADWSEEIPPLGKEIFSALVKQIRQEFSKLDYGRLVIKIQKGRVVQIERTIQQRFTGLDGEGI